MFSNLSQGSPLHILKLKDKIEYFVAPIERIVPTNSILPGYTFGTLEITVSIDGQKKEFTKVPASASVSNSPEYIIADNKETMLFQVNAIKDNSIKVLESIPRHESNVKECEEIAKKLNPEYAKSAAVDNAITQLTERVNNMQAEFGGIKGDVKQVLSILTSGNNKHE